ncbi:MAG: hypothetical protein WCJ09_03515 [Planctomycetota bacterium]
MITAGVCVASPLAKDEITDEAIKALVSQLVSPNHAPEIHGIHAKYGTDFNRDVQKQVHRAWHELRRLAPRSFPFVFDHVSDKRYALTADSGDLDENYSVGFLCRDIVVSSLQPDVWDHKEGGTSFKRRPNQPDYVRHHGLLAPESAKEWWKTRKNLSLREMQLEVLEWVLAEEQKNPTKYTDQDRKKVQMELEALKSSSEPRKLGFPFAI